MRPVLVWAGVSSGLLLAGAALAVRTHVVDPAPGPGAAAVEHRAPGTASQARSAPQVAELAPVASEELERAARQPLVDEPPAGDVGTQPERLLESAVRAVDAFRAEDWDVTALASSLGRDPGAAFMFVRDAIAFDPYPGVLRGPGGTLAARAGNAWDRALLLKALLDEAGHTTRLAFGTLRDEQARLLVSRAHHRPSRVASGSRPTGLRADVVASIGARARRDAAALRLALGERLTALGVDDADAMRRDVSRHAWVQLHDNGQWMDLDPTMPDAKAGEPLTAATRTARDVPTDDMHAVVVRVVTESLSGGRLTEAAALEHEVQAVSASDRHVLLAFLPARGAALGRRVGSGDAGAFVPTLWVGEERHAGALITPAVAESDSGGLDVFGGAEPEGSDLVSVHVEVEVHVPGHARAIARHQVLDRLPPAARTSRPLAAGALRPLDQAGGVPRPLAGFHHVLISTGGIASSDLALLRLQALDAVLSGDAAASGPPPLPALTWPLWARDLELVEGSERVVMPAVDALAGGRAFVARPRVFLSSWFPEAGGLDGIARETDLLIDSIRILPPSDSMHERVLRSLHYGALQSALETETALQMAAAWDPRDRVVVSTSLAMTGALTVFGPGDAARLPPDTAPAMARAVRDGEVVVAPGGARSGSVWWTVARSGLARAVVDPGGGMSRVGPKGGVGTRPPTPDRVNPIDPSRTHERPPRRDGRYKPSKGTSGKGGDRGNEYQDAHGPGAAGRAGVQDAFEPAKTTQVSRHIMKVIGR